MDIADVVECIEGESSVPVSLSVDKSLQERCEDGNDFGIGEERGQKVGGVLVDTGFE